MNWPSVLLWGFVATVVLTTIIASGHGLGLTRMSMTFMLGTMFTPDRRRAKAIGFFVHFINGWIFALVYAAAFEAMNMATWWLGAFYGLVHSLFVLIVAMPILPSIHPRMAHEQYGPTPTRQLQPPGFLAKHYGRRTGIVNVLAHLVYGAILGAFYELV